MLRFFQFIYDAANTWEITPHDLSQQGWPAINTMAGDGTAFAYSGYAGHRNGVIGHIAHVADNGVALDGFQLIGSLDGGKIAKRPGGAAG